MAAAGRDGMVSAAAKIPRCALAGWIRPCSCRRRLRFGWLNWIRIGECFGRLREAGRCARHHSCALTSPLRGHADFVEQEKKMLELALHQEVELEPACWQRRRIAWLLS